jgi:hypothetical protein
MSWASLANNQTVSESNLLNALQTNVFVVKNSLFSSPKQITKAEADYYVYIDTSYAPYAAKSSNQLVVKSDLQPSLYGLGLSAERDTIDETCTVPFTVVQTVSYSGTLGIGTEIQNATIFGNFGYFLIVSDSTGQNTLSTIGINDNGIVIYLEFICPF